MKLTLILLLFLWDNVEFTLTHEECAELPTVERAFVLDEYKKPQYQKGDVIIFSCDPGYTTGVNTIYVCTEHGWRAASIGQCVDGTIPVRLGCTRPPPLKNGYLLRNSTYVYADGQSAKYKCDQFYELKGGIFKTCSNGQWIGNLYCQATFCEKPLVFEEDKERYAENEVLSYSCAPGYKKVNKEPSVCLKKDSAAAPQWSPMPQCEVATCKFSRDLYSSRDVILRPGQTVRVSCGEHQWVKSIELQSAELTCQETGDWDYDRVCQRVTCSINAENVDKNVQWQRRSYGSGTVNIDETLEYQCRSGYAKTSSTAKCTRRGWEPNPLCIESRCSKPSYRNAEITDDPKDIYEHNDRVNFTCTYEPTVTFIVDCYYGKWTSSTQPCKEKPCTTEPHVENGEMLDGKKVQYEHSDRVQFRCDGEINPFTVTCHYGDWKPQNYTTLCQRRQ